ncbi:pyridoxine-5'-phosphate oxidase-like isoform X2 [Ctenocephalides felis]|uniref:pyridoxine-5'-phosphate oxidase-like isoform X2 n=1 Tax=Ctenocephalides felis TaxID=7515 RepID=UPI000E6E45F7|nr:pyridoxine-5'-phosphate oxidase-like isoform X2 [Ctenocephalides felis]
MFRGKPITSNLGGHATINKVYSLFMSIDIGGMRMKYKTKDDTFVESQLVSKNPFVQFKAWFDVACKTPGILEPNAMCLATCSKEGLPSARFVLCKGYGEEGFKFFTNYGSRKAKDLEENPNAALTFYWEPLKRCVRIEGKVQKVPKDESVAYFHSRPRDSQIGACASEQSTVIAGRHVLINKEQELKEKYKDDQPIECPYWGGYIVIPRSIEFWQGQSDRLHDRIKFRKLLPNEQIDLNLTHEADNGWVYERLSP